MTDLKLRFPIHTNNYDTRADSLVTTYEVEICEDCIYRSEGLETEDPDGVLTFDTCHEWDSWNFSFTYPDDDPDGEGEPIYGFSKGMCDGCHTSLGGNRHSMIATYMGETT